MTSSSPGVPASSPQRDKRRWWQSVAVAAQAGILFVTLVMGLLGSFVADNPWFVALAQAAVGLGFVGWLAGRRHGPAMLVVPVVSFALTLGLAAVSNTVAFACSDRALAALEQLPRPPGVSSETFVSPSQGCMVEMTSERGQGAEVFDHYHRQFKEQGWRIDYEEGLWAERNDVYIDMYGAEEEGRVYFIVGRCGDGWSTCLAERGR
jgi:hypothetical protein